VTAPIEPKKKPPHTTKHGSYHQHGLHTLRKALASSGDMEGWLSELGEAGHALKDMRDRMIRDQGGPSKISEGELMTINGILTAYVIQQSLGHFIGNMPCPVNKVRRSVFPVVREWLPFFQAVRDGVKDLSELRKNRPKPEPVSLPEYIKNKASNGKGTPAPTGTTTARCQIRLAEQSLEYIQTSVPCNRSPSDRRQHTVQVLSSTPSMARRQARWIVGNASPLFH